MRKIRSFWARFCQWALGLLGIGAALSSCNKIEDIVGGNLCMYGTPTMDYEIKGKVVDAMSGKAIKGIKIDRPYSYGDAPINTTDSDGKFTITGSAFPRDTLHLIATDIDGSDNGSYSDEKVVVSLKKVGKGDNSWYSGKYAAKDVKIKLKKVSE